MKGVINNFFHMQFLIIKFSVASNFNRLINVNLRIEIVKIVVTVKIRFNNFSFRHKFSFFFSGQLSEPQ